MSIIKTITAIECDGMDVRTLTITLKIFDSTIDIKSAIKNACNDYVKTREGLETYRYNCDLFNWADFESNVPNSICRRYGFEKIDSVVSEEDVNWDEQLIDESVMTLSDNDITTLKSAIIENGPDAIEDFIGIERPEYYDKADIDAIMDEVIAQMPDDELMDFYVKYASKIDDNNANSYDVSIAVDGRIYIHIPHAKDANEAKRLALNEFAHANIGEIECIDFHAVNATDKNDNLTDF